MTPMTSYLKDGLLPNGKEAARKLKVQAARFILIKGVLYKRGLSRPYLRFLIPKEETMSCEKFIKEYAKTILDHGH